MNIWISSGDLPKAASEPCRYGRFLATGQPDDGGADGLTIATLCEVRNRDGASHRMAKAAAWYVGPDQLQDGELLSGLGATGRPVLAAIAGSRDEDLGLLRRTIPAAHLVLAIDATDIDDVSLFERLAAMSRRLAPFALIDDRSTSILAAAAMGASDIILPRGGSVDAAALQRVVSSRQRTASPQHSLQQEDLHRSETEPCLTVRRQLDAGAVLADADLDTALTDYRGLGPAMSDHIVGLRLRYAVAPGEALHFGHFHDRFDDRS